MTIFTNLFVNCVDLMPTRYNHSYAMSSRDITFIIMHHVLFVINKEYFQQGTMKNCVKSFLKEPFLLLYICACTKCFFARILKKILHTRMFLQKGFKLIVAVEIKISEEWQIWRQNELLDISALRIFSYVFLDYLYNNRKSISQ